MAKKLILYIDGASRGNPGPAGLGVVVMDEKRKKLKELCRYLGETTNNIAEYSALIYGLEKVADFKAEQLTINMDSELVVKQLNGEYKVKDPAIKSLFERALGILKNYKDFEIKHIDRAKNKDADKLANKAINLAGLF